MDIFFINQRGANYANTMLQRSNKSNKIYECMKSGIHKKRAYIIQAKLEVAIFKGSGETRCAHALNAVKLRSGKKKHSPAVTSVVWSESLGLLRQTAPTRQYFLLHEKMVLCGAAM